MSIYKSTWLYIKQHNITGLKYFGKTVSNDPYSYNGSGKYWKLHLNKHGNDVTTIWCQLFEDKETLVLYATSFSKEHNITESTEWANLIPENGVGGGSKKGRIVSEARREKLRGQHRSDDAKAKMSMASKGKKKSLEQAKKSAISRTGRVCSEDTKNKLRSKIRSAEQKQKMRDAWVLRKLS